MLLCVKKFNHINSSYFSNSWKEIFVVFCDEFMTFKFPSFPCWVYCLSWLLLHVACIFSSFTVFLNYFLLNMCGNCGLQNAHAFLRVIYAQCKNGWEWYCLLLGYYLTDFLVIFDNYGSGLCFIYWILCWVENTLGQLFRK